SDAARAFCSICVSRLETVVPAELATSMIDWPVCSEDFTASSAPTVARSPCAMAQMAPLSLALATAMPVDTMFWADCSCWLVWLRFASAISAPELVLTLSDISFVPFQVTGAVLAAGDVLPTWEEAIAAPELPWLTRPYIIDFIELKSR